jgi:phage anti-repressor protein
MEKLGTNTVKSTTKRVTKSEKIITETENNVKKLDITKFIEDNPVAKLSGTYQSELLNKIKNEFGEFDQKVFLFNFYCSFNFDEENDFVIDLNHVWPWLGFTRKDHAKRLLEKEFEKDVDFVTENLIPFKGEQDESQNTHGGNNKERILLNVETFKVFCMTAKKPKAKLLRKYYVKLEKLIQQVINKQSGEMKNLLCSKEDENNQLQNKLNETTEELTTKREETLITDNERKKCVYIGMVTDSIVGFGFTDDICRRTKEHKTTHIGEHFILEEVFVTNCEKELENAIKKKLKKYIISSKDTEKLVEEKIIKHPQTELIQLDSNFTLEDLKERIKKYRRNLENSDNSEEILNKLEEKDKIIHQKNIRIQQLEQLLKEANGEIPVEYEIVSDHKLKNEIKMNIIFLEFVLNFIKEYKNKTELSDCVFFRIKDGIIAIEKGYFYELYKIYVETNHSIKEKYTEKQIGRLIPNKGKETFANMKTDRERIPGESREVRATNRYFYINELKEYIPKKIEELKTTNTEKQIKIEVKKDIKQENRSRKKQKLHEFVKSILENFPEYTTKMKQTGVYRVPNDKFYEDYQKFDLENDLCTGKFGEYLERCGI